MIPDASPWPPFTPSSGVSDSPGGASPVLPHLGPESTTENSHTMGSDPEPGSRDGQEPKEKGFGVMKFGALSELPGHRLLDSYRVSA